MGLRGYKAIAAWAQDLSPAARERFGCRLDKGRRLVPSEYVIRNALIRVDPQALDRALQRWNDTYGQHDQSLASTARPCATPSTTTVSKPTS